MSTFQKLLLMIPSTEGCTAIADAAGGIPNKVLIETVRVYPHLAELIAVMQDNPRLHAETHLIGGLDSIDVLAREVGADRLLFGSGAPLYCIRAATLPIQNAPLAEQDKERIFGGNVRDLLGVTR